MKTIAQGRPGVLGCTCGTCRLHSFRRRAAGVSRRLAFPAPSAPEGEHDQQSPGRDFAAGMPDHVICLCAQAGLTMLRLAAPLAACCFASHNMMSGAAY
ncbi:hypothetical protein ACQR09_08505 [Bradyrhizobium oligotrophicum]|uniref:hypothetical protein n=1 Tax=Bradyrhizobium oligotrophicum TaxID=44255 RepID=UPI003EBA8FC2